MVGDKSKRMIELINEAIEESTIEEMIKKLLNEQTDCLVEKLSEQNQLAMQHTILQENNTELKKRVSDLQDHNYELIIINQELKIKLESTVTEMESTRCELEVCKSKYIEEVSNLQQKLSDRDEKIESTQKKLNIIQEKFEPFRELEDAYSNFKSLNDETRKRLSNIFVNSDIGGFIASGMQWENIEGIWNFIKRKVVENEEDDLRELHYIFLVFFEIYNHQRNEILYRLINPACGSQFDSDKHVIIGTKTDGIVKEVALEGIENAKTRKVINKALIVV